MENRVPSHGRRSCSGPKYGRRGEFPLVLEADLSAAKKALTQDNVSKGDLKQAVAMAHQAKAAYARAVFNLEEASLKDRIGQDAYRYGAVDRQRDGRW
ncbi:hypothetical protein KXW65_002281 [Aspergillus fumigatus]|nr:hypothetical protein CNMCM8714_008312 [Aspergillus fumigatus]KAF4276793.1 hypothetical protein CNMCM8689_005805 [Aspergillus fumigatus]KAF4287136.1 hypothetical protein CNMCM8686_004225 [Aspergillus fumigatus]KAH1277743.1 hypothetical protein KXX30_004214 [Aspergillus fumigatus]KAH1460468.1 hypothetical protein KXX53_004280 [Aspergillus fumigatus]